MHHYTQSAQKGQVEHTNQLKLNGITSPISSENDRLMSNHDI